MSDNLLKKEFRTKDVQRMRNIITKNTGDKTTTQIGYTREYVERKEGDIWEENSKQWTIKDGIKQTITKLDGVRKRVTMPLNCPQCKRPMKNRLDKTMYPIHSACFDCVIKHETLLKLQGKYEEYQTEMNKRGLTYHLKEMENVLLELFMNSNEESFVTEGGDIETWKGNDVLRQAAIKDLQEYIQKIKDVLIS
jgi:bacterioferritin-associated ferredoxin